MNIYKESHSANILSKHQKSFLQCCCNIDIKVVPFLVKHIVCRLVLAFMNRYQNIEVYIVYRDVSLKYCDSEFEPYHPGLHMTGKKRQTSDSFSQPDHYKLTAAEFKKKKKKILSSLIILDKHPASNTHTQTRSPLLSVLASERITCPWMVDGRRTNSIPLSKGLL